MRHSSRQSYRRAGTARAAVVAAACAALAVWVAIAADPPRRSVHRDGKAVERTSLEVTRALIQEDIEAVRKALAELEEHSPPLDSKDKEFFGERIFGRDVALHQMLLRVREFATVGEIRKIIDEYVWIQRTCNDCHDASRERGLLPASGPISGPPSN